MKRLILSALCVAFSLVGVLRANRADIYPSGRVDGVDLAVLAAAWFSDDSPSASWNPYCDISEPNDGVIDWLDLGVLTSNWQWTAIDDMVWVAVDDAGVAGHEGFSGEMSRYETTNGQYCQFLNEAFISGDIRIENGAVYGNSGPYNDEIYYDMNDIETQIFYSGGSFFIERNSGYDISDHPVVEVSWYGANAFCDYYGWRLPTEWEWQAVADFNGTYVYGCEMTIEQSKANYFLGGGNYCNPIGLGNYPYTSPVDYYSSYGYGMNDMAGNVWEWTSSVDGGDRVARGGSWYSYGVFCTVSLRYKNGPNVTSDVIGFRVCR